MRKSDIKAIIFLLVLLIGIGVLFITLDNNVELPADSTTDSALAAKDSAGYYGQGGYGYRDAEGRPHHGRRSPYYSSYGSAGAAAGHNGQRFSFDPNTADSTQLLALGLPPWMVRGIYKYRAKGGIYRSPEDFARIPGLTQMQYEQLHPYITISSDYQQAAAPARNNDENKPAAPRDSVQYPQKLRPGQYLDINTADTTELKKIPGIGSYYARLIADYRNRLGGFTSMDQLKEIDRLPKDVANSTADYLDIRKSVRKIAINKLSMQQLREHPYIGYYRAKAITDYRRLKGDITSLQQLSLLPNFTPEDIKRLEPYVEY